MQEINSRARSTYLHVKEAENLPKYYSKEDIEVKYEMRKIQHQTIKGYK